MRRFKWDIIILKSVALFITVYLAFTVHDQQQQHTSLCDLRGHAPNKENIENLLSPCNINFTGFFLTHPQFTHANSQNNGRQRSNSLSDFGGRAPSTRNNNKSNQRSSFRKYRKKS
jgi:hypothetical protein